jgi:hypothetical protein
MGVREEMKSELIRRWREEAREIGMEIKFIKMEDEVEEKVTKRGKVEAYLKENTERTENEKEMIEIKDLWNKYDDWNRVAGGVETYIDTTNEMGVYLGQLGYEKMVYKKNGKVVRGYKKIKYKSETSCVNDFLKEYTIRTEEGEDRIQLGKLTKVYNVWRRTTGSEKISPTEFNNRAKKYGYKMKAAMEKPKEVQIRTGKTVKRNGTIEHCLMRLKWDEEEVKRLDQHIYEEVFREEIEYRRLKEEYDSGKEN